MELHFNYSLKGKGYKKEYIKKLNLYSHNNSLISS